MASSAINKNSNVNYWMIRSGPNGEYWESETKNNFVGISYYDVKNLSEILDRENDPKNKNLRDIMDAERNHLQKENLRDKEFESVIEQFRKFIQIKKGDKIIAISNNSTLLGAGEITGDYKYSSKDPYHTYPVNWFDTKTRTIPNATFNKTIKKLTPEEYASMMSEESQIISSEYDEYSNILERKKQMIFYGPPGTGKTFTANKFAEIFVSKNHTNTQNQDISSMSDEEFEQYVIDRIEKYGKHYDYELIREHKNNLYSLQNLKHELRIAFTFSKSGKRNPTDLWIGVSDSFLKFWSEVPEENCFHIIVNSDTKSFVILPLEIEKRYVKYSETSTTRLDEFNMDSKYDFHISVNKNDAKLPTRDDTHHEKYYDCTNFVNNLDTFRIRSPISETSTVTKISDFIHKVTFHPSYSYEEFVEGIKPKSHGEYVEYPIEPGAFKSICDRARKDTKNKYVLIIDEINRGNISKIFGELITLIEKDKREDTVLVLTYSKKHFTVPKNLFIIGTMNTADRSLTQLDVALRRRFGFCELLPNSRLIDRDIQGIHLGKLLDGLNMRICSEGLREKQIGHSYFMDGSKPIQTIEDLQFVFANEIIPLLQDYFYEDYEAIQKIIGSAFINKNERKIKLDWKKEPQIFIEALKEIAKR